MTSTISKACDKFGKRLLICGDFNLPDIEWTEGRGNITSDGASPYAEEFLICLDDKYLEQHVCFPTRYRDNQRPTCLDLVLTTDPTLVSALVTQDPLGKSDHVCLLWRTHVSTEKTRFTKSSFNFTKGDYAKYKEILKDTDWQDHQGRNTTEEKWKHLKTSILRAADLTIPKRRTGTLRKPKWLDGRTILLIKHRNKAWKKYIGSRNPAHHCVQET